MWLRNDSRMLYKVMKIANYGDYVWTQRSFLDLGILQWLYIKIGMTTKRFSFRAGWTFAHCISFKAQPKLLRIFQLPESFLFSIINY